MVRIEHLFMQYPPKGYVTNIELCLQMSHFDCWVSSNRFWENHGQVFLEPQQPVLTFRCLQVNETLQQNLDSLPDFGTGT
jgi:hypothetical protein